MAAKSKLLGDGRSHGLSGGSALVATPTSRQGEHAFDAHGVCACGIRRKFMAATVCGSLGEWMYLPPGGSWTTRRPACTVVRQ